MAWMWLAGVSWLLLITGGVAPIVWAVARRSGPVGPDGRQGDRSLAILRERIARGENSESEFREQQQILKES